MSPPGIEPVPSSMGETSFHDSVEALVSRGKSRVRSPTRIDIK